MQGRLKSSSGFKYNPGTEHPLSLMKQALPYVHVISDLLPGSILMYLIPGGPCISRKLLAIFTCCAYWFLNVIHLTDAYRTL